MNVNKNINILSLKIWLITMITLVSLIVFVGGLTRLTESGLSITVWEVFKGVFPPLNLQEWNNYFNDYKKIPEYKLLNTEMSLDEFKVIFYWEYSHRMLARLLGFLSIIPLIYFSITYKGFLNNYKRYFILFFLIVFLAPCKNSYSNPSISTFNMSIDLIFFLFTNVSKVKVGTLYSM